MSRLFCPSTNRQVVHTAADDSTTRLLHNTSDFDLVVRRHNRNAFLLGTPKRRKLMSLDEARRLVGSSRAPPTPSGEGFLSTRLSEAETPSSLVVPRPEFSVTVDSSSTALAADDPSPGSSTLLLSPLHRPCASRATSSRMSSTSFAEHVAFLTSADGSNPPRRPSSGSRKEDRPSVSMHSSDAALGTSQPVIVVQDLDPQSKAEETLSPPNGIHQPLSSPSRILANARVHANTPPAAAVAHEPVYFPHNRLRPRNALTETRLWALSYTKQRQRFDNLTDDQVAELLADESRVWKVPEVTQASPTRRSPTRSGDVIALRQQKMEDHSRFLSKVRVYMEYVDTLVEKESEAQQNAAKEQAAARQRQAEWAREHPFHVGGILDNAITKIATFDEQKYSTIGSRYYAIAYNHRKRDVELREEYMVNIERSTFRLGTIMTYSEYCVIYRQFRRYSENGQFLVVANLPKGGWVFVDKVIRQLITRKIDKNKTGKIYFVDLLKHLFPAMSYQEFNDVTPKYEAEYLAFIDKTVKMFLDTLTPDKVNHFAVVFSIVDKLGNGKVLRHEFVQGMPVEVDSFEEEQEVREFLGELFDKHQRRDMNAKLELVGEPYLDLDNLASALSISRYNAYGGVLMSH